jgi:regulator of replication initiation timing
MYDTDTLRDTVREYDRQITNLQYQVKLLTEQNKQLRAYNNYLSMLNKQLINNAINQQKT